MRNIFTEATSKYVINESRMLRDAGRQKKKESFKSVFGFDSQRSTKQLTAAKTFYDWWGVSDYEYSLKVPSSETDKVYPLFGVERGDEEALLAKIAEKYNTNTCYSDFMAFLKRNNIKYEAFKWT